jgi:uncharacterized protein (DUF2141 family)
MYLIAFLLNLCAFSFQEKSTPLTITVNNVKPNSGNVMIAVHNRTNFLKTRLIEKTISASNSSLNITVSLASGEYAIAVYQDENRNQRLDTNLVGIPQEPYAFSNNIRPKFRAPTFDESKITLAGQAQTVNLNLQSW